MTVKGLNITHSVVNTHYNTFFLRKLIDIADNISHDSSPAIDVIKTSLHMAVIFLNHELVVNLKI